MTFNLIDQPFIPCLLPDGTMQELGLMATLARADRIIEIRDPSPMATLALHRLLLAILHRTLGPANLKTWRQIWEAGRFDTELFERYFRKWRNRFDLFDAARPFYQTPEMTTEDPLPAVSLFDDFACNNNATLFDHTVNDPPRPLTLAQAARGLVYRQAFALGLGVSPVAIIKGRRTPTGNRQDGTLARGLAVLVRGENLFETLLCNLTGYTPKDEDTPVWECDDPEERVGQTLVRGTIDLYTAQCRRLRLEPPKPDEPEVVRRVHFAQGRKVSPDHPDPMKPYRRDEKLGFKTLDLKEERALWRDAVAILQTAQDADRQVAALNWVARAAQEGIVPRVRRWTLDVFGAGTRLGKATSLILMRQERMPLLVEYLDNSPDGAGALESLRQAIELAEGTGDQLQFAVWKMAGEALSPLGKPDRDRVGMLVDSLAPDRAFFPALEVPFQRLLLELPQGDIHHRQQCLARWLDDVLVPIANDAFDRTAGQMDRSARAMRAVAIGRQTLHRAIRKISQPFEEITS